MGRGFPSTRMRLFLGAWAALWTILLPVVLAFLWWRGRRDGLYRRHLAERFGRYGGGLEGAVWIHAVSLGEVRSAVPLIRALLDRGETIVVTLFTPAGRREAEAVFAVEIAAGRLCAVWVPFEFDWAYRRFFRRFAPRLGLVMEIEIWPRMIAASRLHGVPLFMCNAQYPARSLARDTRRLGLRAELMGGFAGAMVKSELQAARFASVGVRNIAVTGELRFDQPVPPAQVAAGLALRRWLGAGDRLMFTLASIVAGEDGIFADAMAAALAAQRAAGGSPPLFVYVPRAPERFGDVATLLQDRGFALARRSHLCDAAFVPHGDPPRIDVLLGDSLGEMYAYLAMADRVIVGGGFTPGGSHNISEPLALGRPVMTGPDIHTIEYPAAEAMAAGVMTRLETPEALLAMLLPDAPEPPPAARISGFFAAHSGAVAKTLAALPRLLTSR